MTTPTFPTTLPGLSYPVKRAPNWSTVKQDAISGARTRFQLYTYPTYSYELTFSVLRAANAYTELQTLMGFWHSVQGPTKLFQYRDDLDNSTTVENFGVGDGVSTAFQLVRSFGGYVEPVFMPVTASIYDNGVLKTFAVDWGFGNYGIINFTVPPTAGHLLSWTGTFNWGCRFDDDGLDLSEFMNLLYELRTIKFSTEKLP